MFKHYLPTIPYVREIDFCTDFLPDTQPIYVPICSMDPSKIMELKEHLKYLLDQAFIRLSITPWGTPVLIVKKKDNSL